MLCIYETRRHSNDAQSAISFSLSRASRRMNDRPMHWPHAVRACEPDIINLAEDKIAFLLRSKGKFIGLAVYQFLKIDGNVKTYD